MLKIRTEALPVVGFSPDRRVRAEPSVAERRIKAQIAAWYDAALAEISDAGSAPIGRIAGDGETITAGLRPANISANIEHGSWRV